MQLCAQCGSRTDAGQLYRFYFGKVLDEPPSTEFLPTGYEEAYFCDRCLAQTVVREERNRTLFFLLLGLFAAIVATVVVVTSRRGLWAAIVALLIIAALGSAAFRRYRRLRAVLQDGRQDELRSTVAANQKIQDLGDTWAIRRRRIELQAQGAELFVTREECQILAPDILKSIGSPGDSGIAPSV